MIYSDKITARNEGVSDSGKERKGRKELSKSISRLIAFLLHLLHQFASVSTVNNSPACTVAKLLNLNADPT